MVVKIFEKPEREDIIWIDIEILFEALGAEVAEGRGLRVRVFLKRRKAVFHRPHPEKEKNKLTDSCSAQISFRNGGVW